MNAINNISHAYEKIMLSEKKRGRMHLVVKHYLGSMKRELYLDKLERTHSILGRRYKWYFEDGDLYMVYDLADVDSNAISRVSGYYVKDLKDWQKSKSSIGPFTPEDYRKHVIKKNERLAKVMGIYTEQELDDHNAISSRKNDMARTIKVNS